MTFLSLKDPSPSLSVRRWILLQKLSFCFFPIRVPLKAQHKQTPPLAQQGRPPFKGIQRAFMRKPTLWIKHWCQMVGFHQYLPVHWCVYIYVHLASVKSSRRIQCSVATVYLAIDVFLHVCNSGFRFWENYSLPTRWCQWRRCPWSWNATACWHLPYWLSRVKYVGHWEPLNNLYTSLGSHW